MKETSQIERLRKRAIVLPVIARSDTLTKQQRKSVKEAVLKAFAPGDTIWDDWAATASDDFSSDEDSSLRTELEQNISRPLEITDIDQPYFVFSPEPIVQSKAIDGLADDRLFEKAYPWATIDALDPAASDLVALYSKLLAKMTDVSKLRRVFDCIQACADVVALFGPRSISVPGLGKTYTNSTERSS